MNKVTLAVVAVLLAVPAVAQAKAGIEFDTATTSMKPGDQQTFIAFVHGSGGGGQPMVAFKNDSTGQVMRVRTTLLDRNGMARGTVVFPDYGPWTATLSVDGKVVSPGDGQGFPVGSPTAPARPTPAPRPEPDDGGGLPAWLLTIPAALLAACGILLIRRRRPGELGA